MTDTTRIEHFRNLVSLVAADGKIQDTEKAALSKIAYEQGIPLDRFNIMLQKANEYKYLIPQNQKEREKQLGEMIEVAMVDGEFAPAELDLIGMVAGKLGFSRDDFDAILRKYRR